MWVSDSERAKHLVRSSCRPQSCIVHNWLCGCLTFGHLGPYTSHQCAWDDVKLEQPPCLWFPAVIFIFTAVWVRSACVDSIGYVSIFLFVSLLLKNIVFPFTLWGIKLPLKFSPCSVWTLCLGRCFAASSVFPVSAGPHESWSKFSWLQRQTADREEEHRSSFTTTATLTSACDLAF